MQPINIANVEDKFLLKRVLQKFYAVLRSNISFGTVPDISAPGLGKQDNMRGVLVSASVIVGNNIITHNLGFLPTGYIICGMTALAHIWGINFTTTDINVGSDSACRIILFIF